MPLAAPSPADRLLDAAADLFAREGIRAVGIDTVLQTAKVARASLYQNFGSKDGLIAAYLQRLDQRDRAAYCAAMADTDDPAAQILLAFDLAAENAPKFDFRGCLYVNAATEFPNPNHPSGAVILAHRAWLAATWRHALQQLGAIDSDATLAEIALLYDGALVQAKLTRSTAPIQTARRLAERRLRAARTNGESI